MRIPYFTKVLRACVLSLSLIASLALCIGHAEEPDFLEPEKAFVVTARMASPDNVELRFSIAKNYYMYRSRFSFAIEPSQANALVRLGEVSFPAGKIKHDPTFNQDMELYFDELLITVPLSPWPKGQTAEPFTFKVTGQGCATAGLCYPPMDFLIKMSVSPDLMSYIVLDHIQADHSDKLFEANWGKLLFGSDDLSLASLLASSGLVEIALLFFALGVLLALTPCVLPMVPILSVLLLGQTGAKHDSRGTRGRGFMLAVAYVSGMSVVYTLLGIAAGLSGAGLAAWLQTPWVLTVFALLLAVLALAMFDVYQFQMHPSIQTRLTEHQSSLKGGRIVAAALMEALSALIVGPCVAAPLAGALLYISQTGDVVLGGAALFALAWGMGVPLLVMGASAGKLMPKTGAWMDGVKQFFGVLLLATAWWMVTPLLPSWVQIIGCAALALFAAVLLRTFDALPITPASHHRRYFNKVVRKTVGILLTILSVLWLVGVASGGRSLLSPLAHLATNQETNSNSRELQTGGSTRRSLLADPETTKQAASSQAPKASLTSQPSFQRIKSVQELDAFLAQANKPVMLDFYADWCVSCKEMEAFTFVDPNVSKRLGQMILLQADVTANDPQDRELLKRFKLFGPPGIMFFAAGGAQREDIRVIGFQDARRFSATLDRLFN